MIVDTIFWVLNKIIYIIGEVIGTIIKIFPSSPFRFVKDSQFSDFISQINFFVPVYDFINVLQAWLVAIGIYYLYSVVARWLKAIE